MRERDSLPFSLSSLPSFFYFYLSFIFYFLFFLELQQFFFGGQSIHPLLFQPLYNGQLSTMATFFYSQGGRCRAVQLY